MHDKLLQRAVAISPGHHFTLTTLLSRLYTFVG